MRQPRQHKPDSLVFLILFVSLGMIVTTIAHAENYLFGEPGVLSPIMGISSNERDGLQVDSLSEQQNTWLLPGANGSRTTFKGGMAHIQFDSSDDGDVAGILPVNTRFTLSMGVEENDQLNLPGSANHLDALEWYDRYRPMLYLSVGHRW